MIKKELIESLIEEIIPAQQRLNKVPVKDLTLAIQREFKNSFKY